MVGKQEKTAHFENLVAALSFYMNRFSLCTNETDVCLLEQAMGLILEEIETYD